MVRCLPVLIVASLVLVGCYTLEEGWPPPYIGTDSHVGTHSNNPGTGSDTAITDVDGPGGTTDTTTKSTDTASNTTQMDTGVPTDTLQATDTQLPTDTAPQSCDEEVLCYDPPQECEGESSIKLFAKKGTCYDTVDGPECDYEYLGHEPCQSGTCADGVCRDNPCQGYSCEFRHQPSYCHDDGNHILHWVGDWGMSECVVVAGEATCVHNDESLWKTECQDGCADATDHKPAMCNGAPCAAFYCGLLPADYCDESGFKRQFQAGAPSLDVSRGTCFCDFPEPTPITCDHKCEKGRCVSSNL